MSASRGRLVKILVALNVAALVAVFWVVGVLVKSRDTGRAPAPEAAVEPPVQLATTAPRPEAAARVEPPVEAYVVEQAETEPQEIPAAAPAAEESLPLAIEAAVRADDTMDSGESEAEAGAGTSTIDVYYDGNIVRMQESDASGTTHVVISNSLDDVGALSADDAEYIAALEQLRRGERSHVSIRKVSREAAVAAQAGPETATEDDAKADAASGDAQAVDYYNKVDVGAEAAPVEATPSLARRIEAVVAGAAGSTPVPAEPATGSRKYTWPDKREYLQALNVAAGERANEMRTIRVRRGDSLWTIAERAYGSGYEYPRIYKANPHLTDPDLIREGDLLRVPL